MSNDEYARVDEIKNELEPIINYLMIYDTPPNILTISLKNNISFKLFNQYFPNITRKQLIKLFDFCEKYPKETRHAIKEILN